MIYLLVKTKLYIICKLYYFKLKLQLAIQLTISAVRAFKQNKNITYYKCKVIFNIIYSWCFQLMIILNDSKTSSTKSMHLKVSNLILNLKWEFT